MYKIGPPYPAEFRQQMIELVLAGHLPAQLSRELRFTAQPIANWHDKALLACKA